MANSSTITGTPVSAESTTANFCTISGYLRDISGSSLGGYSIRIRYIYKPFVNSTDTLYLKEFITIKADNTGKVSFKLIQGAQVKIEIPGRSMDYARICTVPSASTLPLVGFIFPYITSFAFDVTAKTILVDESFQIKGTLTFSDGTTETDLSGAEFTSSSVGVATVSGTQVTGVSNGNTTITLTSYDLSKLDKTKDGYGDTINTLNTPTITNTNNLTITV